MSERRQLPQSIDDDPPPKKRGKKAQQQDDTPKFKSLKEAGLESFETVEIDRKQLVNASYNPRVLGDKEKIKLKAALRKHGLVAPITWNERTGHIVGGHQRVSIMDALMRTSDYRLTVARIDVDEKREKELNIVLNNAQAMGSWDVQALKSLLDDTDVELDGTGFDTTDIIQMFGNNALDERPADLSVFAQRLADLSAGYQAIRDTNKRKSTESEFYLVFVFPTDQIVTEFLEHFKLTQNRYQSAEFLFDKLDFVPSIEHKPLVQ